MHITQISKDFSVSPQITAADVTEIANAGFKSIICNRPDFEEPTQPVFNDIANAAHDAGLKTAHVPITAMPTPAQIKEMANAIAELPKPIFAYCRSGNRSSILFHAANA
ncbi:TIGR01244 family protein [Rhodobacteraceae bacterium HIMB11]|nr:TIGR01244 family protein [Rhodobacteraceae bacterium HIMB11]